MQLAVFTAVALISVLAIAVFYIQVPKTLGFGSYRVTADFAGSGGIYPNANVAYRGTTIGKVTGVSLTHDNDVRVEMRIDDDRKVPANVNAYVKSMSAIGEQYVDLVPPEHASTESLRGGSHIGRDRTFINGDIAGMLREAQALVDSLDRSRLRDVLKETFAAFNGSGPELARLLESSRLLVEEAGDATDDTIGLVEQSQPLLDAQVTAGDDIRAVADGLARLTSHLREADPQFREVLQKAPAAADQATTLFDGIRPTFPVLAANLANAGRIGVIYHKSIEQVLVIIPAVTAAIIAIANQFPADEGAKGDFKLNFGDPPPCITGFVPPSEIRSPADTTLRDVPKELYCKVPHNDPAVVRGARNYPCMEFPGKRAATVQQCRDPEGYVPIGSNPWRGPPVPVGTPITDPRMILPQNKYPYIPPQADYDPGPPVVQLPPGVPPGPGPALTPPYPTQIPPVTPGPPPPPLPFQPPPDQIVPPYGRPPAPPPPAEGDRPQAAGVDVATYDPATGKFLDPHTGISVYASGIAAPSIAENWVDLMTYPRTGSEPA
ncbi:virulence factor Mce family protein [Mycolicibacterium thermoresistibile ATCC 19527]|uniref:Virulence factor Mce family protein n=2 Tax=Mycolicibacterium thermoresistibile TaxID=1797 RepID=G7CFW8_MYCT3|nr:virulence factor Mce family protein [Mycolicibacterium thermoresistibile ATCC 19527]